MPFPPHPTLEANPSIRIFFTGLNILTPAADNTCQVFVHNSSNQHDLSIEVRRKRPGKPDVLMMRHHGHLQFTGADPSHTNGLVIRTFLAAQTPGVKSVQGYNGVEPSTEGTKLLDSFSLRDLLGAFPNIDRVPGTPGISVEHGIFYTARKLPMKARIINVLSGEPVRTLTEVPTIIGANIYLNPQNPDHRTTLFWRKQGKEVHLDLKPSADFTYEIYIVNEPLFIGDEPAAPRHGEFEEYFTLMPDVGKPDHLELVFDEEPPERGSNRSPCMSILGDG